MLMGPAVVQGNGGVSSLGTPDDWTHHHLIFSHPGSFADAVQRGSFESWYRVVSDPRYLMQQVKRTLGARGLEGEHRRRRSAVHNDWSMTLGNGGKVGAGQYPAKYSFFTNSTPNCASATTPDFVVYNTGLPGSATQASIVAYDNLYVTTCTGTVPTIYWAYNTGGTATTSPVISLGGDQIAFVQSSASVASLVLLKWANSGGTVGAPAAITSVTNANYRSCTKPCYTTIPFSGSPNDTNSPPFYIYEGADTMYAGDNNGVMHQFTGVFIGTPAESAANGWPVTVSTQTSKILTGAVYDPASTLLFVGDSTGYLYSVTTTGATRTVVRSGLLAAAGSTGIVASPLVDSTPAAPKVYVFVGDSAVTAGSNSVFQFATGFAAGTTGIQRTLGSSSTTLKLYAGAFDNIHYAVAGGAGGGLYVCSAHTGGTAPRLYRIAMNATFTGAAANVNTPTSGAAACSPVTEALGSKALTTLTAAMTTGATTASVTSGTGTANGDYIQVDSEIMHITAGGGTNTLTVTRAQLTTAAAAHASGATVNDITDWIYLSVSALGTSTGCAGACIYNYAVNTTPTVATAGLAANGGTSGIIVDNTSTAAGASQIYYATIANATTTLSAAMTAAQGTATVVSNTGATVGDYVQIDSEFMLVTAKGGTTTLTVTRAQLGTTAVGHASGAAVTDLGTCGTSGGNGGCAVQASQAAP